MDRLNSDSVAPITELMSKPAVADVAPVSPSEKMAKIFRERGYSTAPQPIRLSADGLARKINQVHEVKPEDISA